MAGSINSTLAATLFGSASTNNSLGIGADLLSAYAAAKTGAGAAAASAQAGTDPKAPLGPVWTPGLTPSAAALAQSALDGKSFFDTNVQLYSDLGANGDYRKLFALHSGLTTLQALAARAQDTKLSTQQVNANVGAFGRGLSELQAFFAAQKFDDVRLAQGDRVDAAQTTLAIPTSSEDYTTGVIHRGSLADRISGLDPNAKFNIVATGAGGQRTVAIDLAQMGSIPRSLGAVVSFVNGRLSAAGVASRLAAADQSPKTTTIVIGSRTLQGPYTGPRQYALQIDGRGGEAISLAPVSADPAFYVVGDVAGGARLVKLQDVSGAKAEPLVLDRPAATTSASGDYLSAGWLAGASTAYEQRSAALTSDASNNFETPLRAAGEATLKLQTADGRMLTVSTAWRSDDQENWRTLPGQSSDQAILGDLAQRLTQLLHEQGVAAGVEAWQDGAEGGLSILAGDQISAASLKISGKEAALTRADPPNMVGGLREGVFAREFAADNVGAPGQVFTGDQSFTFTTSATTQTISISGGTVGIDGATLAGRLNTQLQAKGIAAAASFVDNDAGGLALHIDAMHDVLSASAKLKTGTLDAVNYALDLQAPGAWANGGLPVSAPGAPLSDSVRSYDVAGGSPLAGNAGALAIQIVVGKPSGNKTIDVDVTADERANDPDVGGQWSAAFQARLDAALNSAGVYVSAQGGDLAHWSVAEGAGQRLVSVSVNGVPLTLTGASPDFGLGGAFSAERSFTSAQVSSATTDVIPALANDRTASITFNTVWGVQTVSAALDPGDDATLDNAALRLNQALAAVGYDLGVAAVDVPGGGAVLRAVTGASHSVSNVSSVSVGGGASAVTLDPVDALSHADDSPGTLRVAQRAARGAAVLETIPGSSFTAPSAGAGGWFPGRAFDVSVGGGAKIATARAVAAASDGSVYVLANVSGDSTTTAIKGAQDVALFKYDSAGKLAFTEMLGAAQSADGFGLAVSSEGKVAIAGWVTGVLSGTTANGGADSFVTVLDSTGKELWTARRGASADDKVSAIAFAPNGSLVVAGKTQSVLGSQVALGGADGYVRGYSAAGAEVFTKQFGTSGDDAATALAVRDDGANGMEIFTGGVENNRGVLRRFTYSASAGFAAGATRDIGYFYNSAINAIAADGASLYVGGEIGADRLSLGTPARGAVAGQEGFVARLDAGLASTALDRASYLGSAQNDAVKSLAIVNGAVYAAGVSGGVIAGQGGSNAKSGFIARLDDNGEAAWTRTFNSGGGALGVNAMTVQAAGASPLDTLGLPSGRVAANDSAALVARSALRAGDEFQIGAYGGRLTTIQIGASDTMASVVAAINRALSGAGRAQIVNDNGAQRIKITARDGKAVGIQGGREGRDGLSALGLAPGVIATNSSAALDAMKNFGLGLIDADLKLDNPANIASTKAQLSAAVSIVRQAYDALLHPHAKPETDAQKALDAKKAAAGRAPQYLTDQLANYKAALARLGR